MRAFATMTRRVIVAPPQLSLDVAWKLMQEHRFRHLPIVQGGVLLGIVSDRDVLVRARLEGDQVIVPKQEVVHAMTPSPVVCEPSTSVSEIVRVMTERKIDALPVVNERERLVGLVTSTDLLLLLVEPDTARPLPFTYSLEEASTCAAA